MRHYWFEALIVACAFSVLIIAVASLYEWIEDRKHPHVAHFNHGPQDPEPTH